jgi:hypothetical protein
MWIPAPVYASLPYAYVLVGSVAAVSVNNLLAWISGGFLIAVGSLIWLARRSNRA